MSAILEFFKRIKTLKSADIENLLLKPADTDTDQADKLAGYYIDLLSAVAVNHGPVTIDRKDVRHVTVDGTEYCLDESVGHNDRKLTECLCAIDAILADATDTDRLLCEVESRLSESLNRKGS